jgi:hypothetical protein
MKTRSLISLAAGIAGGIVGTMFMQQATKLGGKLPKSFQPRMKGNPFEVVFDKVEDLTGRELVPETRHRLEPLLPYLYGTTGPLVLGALAHKLGRGSIGRTLGAGAVMGAIVWAVGFLGWLPRSGVAEPIQRQPIGATANGLVGHAAYGVLSALPVALVERFV